MEKETLFGETCFCFRGNSFRCYGKNGNAFLGNLFPFPISVSFTRESVCGQQSKNDCAFLVDLPVAGRSTRGLKKMNQNESPDTCYLSTIFYPSFPPQKKQQFQTDYVQYRNQTNYPRAARRNPNFRGSQCTLTGRGSRTHPNWSGQKLQAALLCELPPKRRGNSHSAPAGRMVYNIYGL